MRVEDIHSLGGSPGMPGTTGAVRQVAGSEKRSCGTLRGHGGECPSLRRGFPVGVRRTSACACGMTLSRFAAAGRALQETDET